MNIIIYRCPIGQRRWHYAPETALKAMPNLRMDDDNGFDTLPQAHAAAAADQSIPAGATLKLESGVVLPRRFSL